MADLIDRQAVLGYIERLHNTGLGKKKALEYLRLFVARAGAIEATEYRVDATINLWRAAYDRGRKDAERLQAKVPWVPTASGTGRMCGACGWTKHPADRRNYSYCPNCGQRKESER